MGHKVLVDVGRIGVGRSLFFFDFIASLLFHRVDVVRFWIPVMNLPKEIKVKKNVKITSIVSPIPSNALSSPALGNRILFSPVSNYSN